MLDELNNSLHSFVPLYPTVVYWNTSLASISTDQDKGPTPNGSSLPTGVHYVGV